MLVVWAIERSQNTKERWQFVSYLSCGYIYILSTASIPTFVGCTMSSSADSIATGAGATSMAIFMRLADLGFVVLIFSVFLRINLQQCQLQNAQLFRKCDFCIPASATRNPRLGGVTRLVRRHCSEIKNNPILNKKDHSWLFQFRDPFLPPWRPLFCTVPGDRGVVLVLDGPRHRGDEEPPVSVVVAVGVTAAAALDQLGRSQDQPCWNFKLIT